ncbi:carbamoyl-phosphate synthase (glutamine-hydrolyzing) large subunit [candidate division GN15 bacterium]|nr:carbamoyl-phosphate synthase (glutamine-hydrolyzing) large subunit [candidate division GN15 bacterium]
MLPSIESQANTRTNGRSALPAKVLVLGSSALKIGEAGEFDYSGSQAIKALKEEGVATVLINPNVATIQTSEYLADETYFVPVTPEFVEKVIVQEKPDGILLGFGGQTALNCGVDLYRSGVLEKHGVEILGAPIESVIDTEDRDRFIQRLNEVDVQTARSVSTTTVDEAVEAGRKLGFPCMARVAYALGGLGSGICRSEDELRTLAHKAFAHTEQVLIEEYLEGWKEIEYEVVRDAYDNCVTVCNMENLDPMGIHTGESIVVAPSQTLTDDEYQMLREISIRVVRHLKIVGECNIQFALSPRERQYRVIEINARLSRSSALASKATGYPLAFVAAKLVLGRALTEVENSVTRKTQACFEPALDYVVVKAPRWDLKKFQGVSERIGSAMKSVGEVMAIGRKFEEALQKAVRMLDTGADGVVLNDGITFDDLKQALAEPTDERIFAVAEALKQGMTTDDVHKITHINPWFIEKIANMVSIETRLRDAGASIPEDLLRDAKKHGFSDCQIARATKQDEDAVLKQRREIGLRPVIKQIDTLAAEFAATTNYLYLTYNGSTDDVDFGQEGAVMIIGPGAYRIGSSVEFDWCCVNAVRTLRELGYRTIMVNHNPETVSTDYDECDRLYFDELSFEAVNDIYQLENPLGLILSVGGQVPNSLAMTCAEHDLRVLGTSPQNIDRAENRHKFSSLLEEMDLPQPPWRELTSMEEISSFVEDVGYPVIIRPSYVLSGAAMAVAGSDEELETFLTKAADVSPDHPVVVSKFIQNAKEIDIDAVARDGEIVCFAVSEHVENAGVHSGDATLVLPPQRTYLETMRRIHKVGALVASKLNINGPFNIQFLAKDNEVMVIECNLRAARSFPFVSKVLKTNFIEAATRVIMGRHAKGFDTRTFLDLDYVGVKAPQFSFSRLAGADPTLGVEMASTGEVACLGWDFDEAFLKALLAVGYRFPIKTALMSTGPVESKAAFLESARRFAKLGIKFYATQGTAEFLQKDGLDAEVVAWPLDQSENDGPPNAVEVIKEGKIDLVINIPKDFRREELANDYLIRRTAVDFGVPLITNRQLAERLAEALSRLHPDDLKVQPWRLYGHQPIDRKQYV